MKNIIICMVKMCIKSTHIKGKLASLRVHGLRYIVKVFIENGGNFNRLFL